MEITITSLPVNVTVPCVQSLLLGEKVIESATEGVKLNDLKVVALSDELGGRIQTGVIHPLVEGAELSFGMKICRQAILGENIKTVT